MIDIEPAFRNLTISATRIIVIPPQGKMTAQKSEQQNSSISAWQVPEEDCRKIVDSSNPLELYIDWVKSQKLSEPSNITEDILNENGDVIGSKPIDWVAYHLKELASWVEYCEENGFVVTVSSSE